MIELFPGAQGPDLGIVSERVADANPAGALDQFLEDLLANARLNKHPRTSHATLSGGTEIAGDYAVNGTLDVGIIKNQDRGLATQFERYHGKVFSRISHNVTRGFRSPGKRNPGNIRMARQQSSTGFAVTGNDVNHARRKSCFFDDPGKLEHRCRGHLRCFQHHRIARGQCWPQLGCGQKHLRIPRHYGSNYPDRNTLGVDVHIRFVDR